MLRIPSLPRTKIWAIFSSPIFRLAKTFRVSVTQHGVNFHRFSAKLIWLYFLVGVPQPAKKKHQKIIFKGILFGSLSLTLLLWTSRSLAEFSEVIIVQYVHCTWLKWDTWMQEKRIFHDFFLRWSCLWFSTNVTRVRLSFSDFPALCDPFRKKYFSLKKRLVLGRGLLSGPRFALFASKKARECPLRWIGNDYRGRQSIETKTSPN